MHNFPLDILYIVVYKLYMDLHEYCKFTGKNIGQLAVEWNMKQPTLNRIANGVCKASANSMEKIIMGSNGMVSFFDLLHIQECIASKNRCQGNN